MPHELGFAFFGAELETLYSWRPWRTNGDAVGTGGSRFFWDQG
jgi:hypothetical protein